MYALTGFPHLDWTISNPSADNFDFKLNTKVDIGTQELLFTWLNFDLNESIINNEEATGDGWEMLEGFCRDQNNEKYN